MTKYFVCWGVNNSHVDDNVEVFELYRDAKDFYHSIGGAIESGESTRYSMYMYKAKWQRGELIQKIVKQYNFDKHTNNFEMLTNLGLMS